MFAYSDWGIYIRPVRHCIITPEIIGPYQNGGIGTHCYYFARWLSKEMGHDVTILYTSEIETHDTGWWKDRFREQIGVDFVLLPEDPADLPPPAHFEYSSGIEDVSRRVYQWLESKQFDACHFQEMLGNGYHTFQAKRLGLAFQNTALTCMVHSSWTWINQAMQVLPDCDLTQMRTKFMERYCVRHCDFLLSPSAYMLAWTREHGYDSPAPSHTLPYLLSDEIQFKGHKPVQDHLIFFGRLEARKGIALFLDAVRLLDGKFQKTGRKIKITFLGRKGTVPGFKDAAEYIQFHLKGLSSLSYEIKTDLGHHEAHEFLTLNSNALVVCPSLVDNLPFAVIEALQMGLNVVSTKTGGIPELFNTDKRLCSPDPQSLSRLLFQGLENRLPPLKAKYSLKSAKARWKHYIEKDLAGFVLNRKKTKRPAHRKSASTETALVILPADYQPDLNALKKSVGAAIPNFKIAYLPSGGNSQTLSHPAHDERRPLLEEFSRDELLACSHFFIFSRLCLPGADSCHRLVDTALRTGLPCLSSWAETTDERSPAGMYPLGPCIESALFEKLPVLPYLYIRGHFENLIASLPGALNNHGIHLLSLIGDFNFNAADLDIAPKFWARVSEPLNAHKPLETSTALVARSLTRLSASPLQPWTLRVIEHAVAMKNQMEQSKVKSGKRTSILRKLEKSIRMKRKHLFGKLSSSIGKSLRHLFRPELCVSEIFPSIEDEYAAWRHLFSGRVLNAGAGNRDIRHLIHGELYNQDIPGGLHNSNIHIHSPLDSIPKPDNYFDCIICNAVLEHVKNPHEVMSEFYRVLRPAGVLYLAVPFLQPEHLDPTDYQRYTRDGLKQLCLDHGFKIEAAEGLHSVHTTLAWILIEWLEARRDWRSRCLKIILYPWLRLQCRRAHAALKANGGNLPPEMHGHSIASCYRVIARKDAAADPWLKRWGQKMRSKWADTFKYEYENFVRPSPLASMTVDEELAFLKSYARNAFQGKGRIVDLGIWFGATTRMLAEGLKENKHIQPGKHIQAYDLFRWEEWMKPIAKQIGLETDFHPGDSFAGLVRKHLKPFEGTVEVIETDLATYVYPGHPIEFLFVDANKSWALADAILRTFFPHLIPGESIVVQQDFAYHHPICATSVLGMYKYRECFERIEHVSNSCSVAFFFKSTLPENLSLSPDDFEAGDIVAGYNWAKDQVSDDFKPALILAKCLFLIERGFEEALVNEVQSQPEPFAFDPAQKQILADAINKIKSRTRRSRLLKTFG